MLGHLISAHLIVMQALFTPFLRTFSKFLPGAQSGLFSPGCKSHLEPGKEHCAAFHHYTLSLLGFDSPSLSPPHSLSLLYLLLMHCVCRVCCWSISDPRSPRVIPHQHLSRHRAQQQQLGLMLAQGLWQCLTPSLSCSNSSQPRLGCTVGGHHRQGTQGKQCCSSPPQAHAVTR